MILHSIVCPEYIFPYEVINSSFESSTNPYDYINGSIVKENQYLTKYINFWRETNGSRKER